MEDIKSVDVKFFLNELLNLVRSQDIRTPVVSSALKIYTIPEVAAILKCKERTVIRHLHESRDLKYCKIGREVRISEEDLIKLLKERLKPCVLDPEE